MKKQLLFVSFILLGNLAFGQQSIDSLLQHLEKFIEKKNIPGAMISIVQADSIIYIGGVGYANVDKKEKVNDKHLFRQGSISKSITGLGLVKALHSKKETLQTPIKEIDSNIPFTNPWSTESPVTIENLLEHTAGFDDMHFHAIYNKTDATTPPVAKMVESHKKSLTSRWKPGTRKAYSNPGYVVAGHVLEVLSNQPYHQYLKDEILNPIGMTDAGFYFKEPKDLPMAQGYQYNGNTFTAVPYTTIQGGPAGELGANANDMAALMQFFLRRIDRGNLDTLIFDDTTFDRIENSSTTVAAKKGLPHGYGLGNYSIWKNGYQFNGHSGGIDGFSSRYLYSRDANLGVAVCINREGNANAVANEILDFLLPKSSNNRVTQSIPDELKEKYTGFYGFQSPRHILLAFTDRMLAGLTLDFKGADTVITRTILGKAKDTLYYAGNNQFYMNDDGTPSVLLFDTDEGEQRMWVNGNYTTMQSWGLRLTQNIVVWLSMLLPFFYLLYGVIGFTVRFFSKEKKPIINQLILWGACFSYALLLGTFSFAMSDIKTGGDFSLNGVLLFLSGIALVLLSIFSVFRWTKLPKGNAFRFFYILFSISVVVLSIFFWYNGFVGLRLWAY